jgi:CheY-like chemotaxis protein
MLNNLGHKVLTATSGQAALAMLRRADGFDVAVIDHTVPDMTGTELVELIRMERPMIGVLFATPPADADLQQIPKPLRQEDVAAAITQAVARRAVVRLGS